MIGDFICEAHFSEKLFAVSFMSSPCPGFQRDVCFTHKLKNTKTPFPAASPLAEVVSRSSLRKRQAHIAPIRPISFLLSYDLAGCPGGRSREEEKGQKTESQYIWCYLYLEQLSKEAESARQ